MDKRFAFHRIIFRSMGNWYILNELRKYYK